MFFDGIFEKQDHVDFYHYPILRAQIDLSGF